MRLCPNEDALQLCQARSDAQHKGQHAEQYTLKLACTKSTLLEVNIHAVRYLIEVVWHTTLQTSSRASL